MYRGAGTGIGMAAGTYVGTAAGTTGNAAVIGKEELAGISAERGTLFANATLSAAGTAAWRYGDNAAVCIGICGATVFSSGIAWVAMLLKTGAAFVATWTTFGIIDPATFAMAGAALTSAGINAASAGIASAPTGSPNPL